MELCISVEGTWRGEILDTVTPLYRKQLIEKTDRPNPNCSNFSTLRRAKAATYPTTKASFPMAFFII